MMKLLLFLLLTSVTLFAKIGIIAAINGDAHIQRSTKELLAKIGTPIEKKDTITTQKNTKVQVVMLDDTIITIGENSIYSFEEYGKDHAKMKLKKGFFRAITGKIGKISPEKFKISTKSATIGIRGTHFSGYIDDETEVIKCFRGEITVDTALKLYSIPEGKMITLSNTGWVVSYLTPKSNKTNNIHKRPTGSNINSKKQNINIQELEKLRTKIDVKIITPKSDVPSFDPDK